MYRCMLEEIDNIAKEEDSISIGACSLSKSNVQIDSTSQEKHDTLSKGAVSLSGSVQRMNITPNKQNDTSNKEDGITSNREDDITSNRTDGVTSNKEDDVSSIGTCSLSDTDEQMVEKDIFVEEDLKKSNDSGKQKDVEDISNTSPKTGLYIDPIVMDSRKEILLNLKNLIEQNVKQIKDMRKCKAQLNIAVHKAELRVERTKKSNDEMKVKITALRADFWLKAKQFPATVSLKVNKFDNWVRKRKQDIVDDLNTVKRKETLLKEFIPKLIKENALRKTWTPTVPMITLSPVIEHLNLQFLEEFGTVFRFKKLKPGIYFRHPFYRTTYHVAEEKVEKFKEKHPYFYYNCQRYIKNNDVEVFHQQTEEIIWYDEKKQGLKDINQKVIEDHDDVEKKQVATSKRKTNSNETSLEMKRCNVMKIRNEQEDPMAIDGSTDVKTQTDIGVKNIGEKTPKRKENNKSDDRIVQNKSQAPTKTTRKTIVDSKLNIDKDKATRNKIASNILKERKSRVEKVKTDTNRSGKEIIRKDKGKNQENMNVDKIILERLEKLRALGKDAFVKTAGDKSFIYIKPDASHGTEIRSDNNRHLTITVTKRGQSVSDAKIIQRPPFCPIKHAALNRFDSTKQSNSLLDNIRVHAKPVPVKGKTKIPLFIRQNVAYKTPTPRKPPNSNVPSPRIHLKEGQSKRDVIQRKRKTHESESIVSDAFDNKVKADRDKSNMDRQIPVSRNDITKDFTRPQTKTFNKFRHESQKQRQSLIPISVNYLKEMQQRKVVSREPTPYGHKIPLDQTFKKFRNESQKQRQSLIPISVNYLKEMQQRKVVSWEPVPYLNVGDQNKSEARKPTPYDHIISQVIGEYMPWSDDEDDAYGNPEVNKDKPENSHHDKITVKENENNRTKETLKTKVKVKSNESQSFLDKNKDVSIEPSLHNTIIVRDQSKDVFKEPTPYDHIISQVIGEYMPWSDDEDDVYDNPEVNKDKPKNSHHDTITVREIENNRTKQTLTTKEKVKSNGSQGFLDQNNDVSIEPSLHDTIIVRDQSKDVSREPTPYDHVISEVIGEYLPWSDEEDDTYDNPEVDKDKPENSHHDNITVREKENNRTKETLKTKGNVKSNGSQYFLEDDKTITKKSRNVILLPPITPTSSPTKRARSRSERCKSYKSEKKDKSNNDSLAINVNSTLNDRSSVSITVPKKSVRRTKLSDDVPCNSAQRSERKKNEIIEIVPHPPESSKDKSNRKGRKLRTPKGKEIGLIASKMSKETNGTSAETFERGIPSTANIDHDSCDSLSKRSTKFAEHTVSKTRKTLLENIDERMLSSVMDEQFNSGAKSLRGQSQLRLPPIRNH